MTSTPSHLGKESISILHRKQPCCCSTCSVSACMGSGLPFHVSVTNRNHCFLMLEHAWASQGLTCSPLDLQSTLVPEWCGCLCSPRGNFPEGFETASWRLILSLSSHRWSTAPLADHLLMMGSQARTDLFGHRPAAETIWLLQAT